MSKPTSHHPLSSSASAASNGIPRDPMSIAIFDIPPHPAADVFPMLPDDELEELAFDIKANGLQQPLVIGELDGVPRLVDGRNRREACKRAGIIPDYVLFDGQDPVAYILSANINRRHMSKGQRAMVVAKVCKETLQGTRKAGIVAQVSHQRIHQANTVLSHAPDLSVQVINGTLSLDKAYEEAKIRKGQAENYESVFNALKANYPDLADLVVEDKLSLKEACAAEQEREARERHNKKLTAEALHDLARHAYLLNQAYRDSTLDFVLSEAELYKQHNCGPVDEFIQALEIFAQHAAPLLARINEQKAEKENAEKGG